MTRELSGRNGDGGEDADGVATATRRSVLRTAAVGAAGLTVGTGAIGSGAAAGIPTPPLVRACNKLVDPTGQEVILRGVAIADPGRQLRPQRGQTADETVALALDESAVPPSDAEVDDAEGWHNDVIRIPIQPQDVYAGTDNASANPASAMPHGDAWGPVMPGETGDSPAPITEATLTEYVEEILDPLIDRIERAGAYAMLTYHRHYPVFQDVIEAGECDPAVGYGGGVCGERGVLWHGADQVEDVEKNAVLYDRHSSEVEPWTEPTAVAEALDEELRTFWAFFANAYADRDHVLFDVYGDPGGPYETPWGAPDRTPLSGGDDSLLTPYPRDDEVWWNLWVERAQPWIDVVEEHAPGSVVTIGSPKWSRYTYHAGVTSEFDVDELQMCYTGQIRMQEGFDLPAQFGPPSEEVPLFFTDFGWAEGGGRNDAQHLWATTTGSGRSLDFRSGRERFEPFVEHESVHPIASYFDNTWEPTFFDHEGATGADGGDWMAHLADYESRHGQWWMRYLYEKRGEDDPSEGGGSPPVGHCGEDPALPPVGDSANAPRDPDHDGLYEDVNGDGAANLADAGDLFQHREADAVTSNVDAYDFSGNEQIDLADVVDLFQENTR